MYFILSYILWLISIYNRFYESQGYDSLKYVFKFKMWAFKKQRAK